ncbi:hypothetical protein DB346_03365 [Verrucomicrobia bacterium LW23]|nr:hypothetical protein DB346_03365 [Verrucomicrobia bacterium LW23]
MKSPTLHLRPSPRLRHCAAFTLVELMVAMMVLTLVMGLLLQIFSGTVRATQNSHRQMVAMRQARMVLDPLRKDLTALVAQGEAATIFVRQDSGNATLAFLTRNRGPQGVSDFRFLAVAYELAGTQLTRKAEIVTWGQPDLMAQALAAVTAPNVAPLSNSVLRFEVMVVLDNGTTEPLSTAGPWKSDTALGETVPSGFYALRLAGGAAPDPAAPRVRSLTVAVATVEESILRLPGATNIGALLPSPAAGQTPHEAWNTLINSGALNAIPQPAISTMRIVQMTVPVR